MTWYNIDRYYTALISVCAADNFPGKSCASPRRGHVGLLTCYNIDRYYTALISVCAAKEAVSHETGAVSLAEGMSESLV
ncbi:hypothetical protein DWZ56_09875 [Lachnotalea sp. AF33-28]|nr:hypothetical protein DWZ56_09875 [Lachnotalea sp. AF33-28]